MASSSTSLASAACACTTLRKASRAVSRLYEEKFSRTGMTITQFSVLRALSRKPDQPLSRLAEAMVMDRTSLYRLLAPMERDGLLQLSAGSGRARIASMTSLGLRTMVEAAPVWEAVQTAFLERFGQDQWANLSFALDQLLAAAEGGSL